MEIFDPVSKLRDRGIDVNNSVRAVTIAEDWEATQDEYETAAFEITGRLIHTGFECQARHFYINLINQIVRVYGKDNEVAIDVDAVVAAAKLATASYFLVMRRKIPDGKTVSWRSASPQELQQRKQVHKDTYVRPKTKQERAIEIVRANLTMSNKDLQAIFREELKLTPNGAATYVYNVRKLLAK